MNYDPRTEKGPADRFEVVSIEIYSDVNKNFKIANVESNK